VVPGVRDGYPWLNIYPKIFLGYSDVTILLNWLRQSCKMVTFHAPMVAMDLSISPMKISSAGRSTVRTSLH